VTTRDDSPPHTSHAVADGARCAVLAPHLYDVVLLVAVLRVTPSSRNYFHADIDDRT
jgi:hypothetical protein